jgi:hypothetical protein
VRDDRGHEVNFHAISIGDTCLNPTMQDPQNRGMLITGVGAFGVLIVLPVFVFLVSWMFGLGLAASLAGVVFTIFGLPIFVALIGAMVVFSFVPNRRHAYVSRQRVDAGLCGACGHPLAPADGDGFAVCSECGGAWRA